MTDRKPSEVLRRIWGSVSAPFRRVERHFVIRGSRVYLNGREIHGEDAARVRSAFRASSDALVKAVTELSSAVEHLGRKT